MLGGPSSEENAGMVVERKPNLRPERGWWESLYAIIDAGDAARRSLCGGVHTRPVRRPSICLVHEFSVCQALLAQVAAIAAQHDASRVARIAVEVGPLSGVEPALLAAAFAVACQGSCAAGAVLAIEPTAVMVRCTACGARSSAAPYRLVCEACGGYRTQIISGDELLLRRVELLSSETETVA
jgi:hydrogenase nickel incorporation protein HypA/HybF